jgi:hypothetical protein
MFEESAVTIPARTKKNAPPAYSFFMPFLSPCRYYLAI